MKPLRPPRKPSRESRRWFQDEWRKVLLLKGEAERVEAASGELARLSYENKALRARMSEIEDHFEELGTLYIEVSKLQKRMERNLNSVLTFLNLELKKPQEIKRRRFITTDDVGKTKSDATKDDMVMVGSTPHLHECDLAQKKLLHKMVDRTTKCTCGSEGSEGEAERRRRSN
jgi:chromosome segregation ATPase